MVCGLNRAGLVGRYIYVFGEAIEPEFELLERFLVPGGVLIVDIGGNTGIYTTKAAQFFRQNGGGLVVTYELMSKAPRRRCWPVPGRP